MAGEIAKRVGQRIRQARLEQGMQRQRDLADAMGGAVDNQRISDWERGVNEPSDRYWEQLTDILKRPRAWFYDEQDSADETPDLMGTLGNLGNDAISRLEAAIARLQEQVDRLERRGREPGDEESR